MTVKTLKPAPGRAVRDPSTRRPLAIEGEAKELDTFWRRRLAAGDVVEVDPANTSKQPGDRIRINAFSDGTAEMEVIPDVPEPAGTPSGSSQQPPEAEPEKTNSRRARRAAQAED